MDNTFQIILIGAFILFALVGVVLFASPGLLPSDSERPPVSFSVWGEWERGEFEGLLDTVGITDDDNVTISYTHVSRNQFEEQLVNALARGQGPDVILLPHTKLLTFSDLLTVISEDFYPSRQFRDSFVEGSEIFLSSQGVSALPIAVDPMVMYWNRDILTEAGYVSPPETWSQVSSYVQNVTEADNAGNISTAGIALGTADNVSHTKQILSSLFLQAGNSIVVPDQAGELISTLSEGEREDVSTLSAVGLYTQYANPDTSVYTWNNSFDSDRQEFVAGNLAFYLAPASEIQGLRQRNPNLNFDVTLVPQLTDGQRRTHGDFYGLAILNQAANKAGILTILQELTGSAAQEIIASQTSLAPVHKSVLAAGATDAYQQMFFDSAVIARGWLDPAPEATEIIFRDIVRDVTSGQHSISGALQVADTSLRNQLRRILE